MAKPVQTQTKSNGKAIAAFTLAVLLVLTVVFGFLGITGRKLDSEGLYKLLPFIPTPTQRFEWREALVPGADFGETTTYQLALPEDAAKDEAVAAEAIAVLSQRLGQMGITGSAIDKQADGKLLVTLPKNAMPAERMDLMASVGAYSFADSEGVDFLDGKHITKANIAPADQAMKNWHLAFELDAEGKKIFADKTTELVGKSVVLKKDGVKIVEANIGEPLLEGGASIPGFTYEDAFINSVLMRTGKLPVALTDIAEGTGAPMLGQDTLKSLVLGMWIAAAVICLCFIVRFRLMGLIASWTLVVVLMLNWLFAALTKAGMTVTTMLAVLSSFALAAVGVLVIFNGMADDLKSGRAARQALKDSYAGPGHIALDMYIPLFILSLVLIILDNGAIGYFMQRFAIGMLVNLCCISVLMRVLLSNTFELFGGKSALYIGNASKEAV